MNNVVTSLSVERSSFSILRPVMVFMTYWSLANLLSFARQELTRMMEAEDGPSAGVGIWVIGGWKSAQFRSAILHMTRPVSFTAVALA